MVESSVSGSDMSRFEVSPRVLLVIPCLNEAKTIDPLLHKLALQRGNMDMLIVVADGGSKDGTIEIVQRLTGEISDLVLMDNPRRIQSAAINLAVDRFGGDRDYLIRIDAHGDYPDNYCRALIEEAESKQADSVVVGMETVGFGAFQQAAAIAQNSKLGNGGSKHRAGGGGEWVDHGHHALMRIAAYSAVGGYDESFSHNEDAELDFRLRRSGFRIWMTGKTYMTYYPRSSASALFRQYLGYGRGRAKNLMKHGSIPKIRQAIPLAVAPVVAGAVLALLHWWAAVPFAVWVAACLAYGAYMAIGQRNMLALFASIPAMIMHFAWSAGFWMELIGFKRKRAA
ncbi:succinoglycan biosynthesis protein ExoA [Rhizobium sp. NFR07]|nr:succinoglycan biosynthesis protein ExoA [Rhizobium sp. NFR07]